MKKYKSAFIGIPIFLIVVAVFVYFDTKQKHKTLEKLGEEYPLMTTAEQINASIHSIFLPEGFRDSPYGAFVTLSNSEKRDIRTDPYMNRKYYFNNILAVGDSISKKAGNDSIYLYKRDGKSYYFVLYFDEY